MKNFLAYIADRYSRKTEDVASDALLYVLRCDLKAQESFRDFIVQFSYSMPEKFSIEPRTKGEGDDSGIPDLKILDENRDCCVVIENKFDARLTRSQLTKYFEHLQKDDGGLLLFIVPRRRGREIWEKLERSYQVKESLSGGPFFGEKGKNRLKVVSWEDVIEKLRASKPLTITFIQQLGELCEMDEKERIKPFQNAELLEKQIGCRVWDYSRLSKAIAESSDGCFELLKRQPTDACGYGWAGAYVKMNGFTPWIGFSAEYWAQCGVGPIWIAFENQVEAERLIGAFGDRIKSEQWYTSPMGCGQQRLLIPIHLRLDAEQEEVIEDAVRQLKEIASKIKSI